MCDEVETNIKWNSPELIIEHFFFSKKLHSLSIIKKI